MNKKLICIVILSTIFLACRGPTDREEGDVYYRTGNSGITLNFMYNTPDEIYENEDAEIIVELRNEGAFPQADEKGEFSGRIWIGGYDPNIMELVPEELYLDDMALEGKSPFNPRGGYDTVRISTDVYNLPKGVASLPQTIQASVTYLYKTIASPLVCIDPTPRSTYLREKVCDVEDYRSIGVSSQGAPVDVISVDERVTSENILFTIRIKNMGYGQGGYGQGYSIGMGKVIDEDLWDDDPHRGYDINEIDRVRIDEISVGSLPLICQPDDSFVKLVEGEGTIFCKLPTAGISDVYLSPLTIVLKYGYLSSIYKNINILEEVMY
jgi:hypothetical protein